MTTTTTTTTTHHAELEAVATMPAVRPVRLDETPCTWGGGCLAAAVYRVELDQALTWASCRVHLEPLVTWLLETASPISSQVHPVTVVKL